MKKVTIYALADRRPDFIEPQFHSLKKHITDDYTFVILNNAFGSRSRRKKIREICERLGITCVDVTNDKRYNTVEGKKAFTWYGTYVNPNVACAYPLKWAWHDICCDNKDKLAVIIDSDMFLYKDISFNAELSDKQAAYIVQYRGPSHSRKEMSVAYPWNGICVFDIGKIEHVEELDWECGVVNGHPVDVGGMAHFWKAKETLTIKHISEYAIHKFEVKDSTTWLEATLNGNYHFSFDYDKATKAISNYHCYETGWQKDDIILPHFPADFQTALTTKTIAYFERFLLDKQTYPKPSFIGFIEFETFTQEIDPFIVHHKAGSGYVGFDENYRQKKLAFIKELCKLEQVK